MAASSVSVHWHQDSSGGRVNIYRTWGHGRETIDRNLISCRPMVNGSNLNGIAINCCWKDRFILF